jgi:hydrogenase-4 component B
MQNHQFDLIASPGFFIATLLIYAGGAIGSLLLQNNDRRAALWSTLAAIAGSILGVSFAVAALLRGIIPAFTSESTFPLLSTSFYVDSLSALFVLAICLVALCCSIYALGYLRHYYAKYNIGLLGFFYHAFIASMILVVTVHNALSFLIVWELMSLASFFLVIYEHRDSANIRAGILYFVMTHVGTAFVIFAFLLMYQATGSFEFSAIRVGLDYASPILRGVIFLAALIGFGTKAGMIPVHIWLPSAHPAAPSHVSALMSGVMIKTGIYMLIRVSLDLLPPGELWWGMTVLVAGSLSALLGVLYALSEHDLKKLLAYHSIENIGIILMGIGCTLAFSATGHNTLATFSLIAALYHTINHATFKALLFLGAGAVISATQTRNIEHYGGMIKTMPQTALFFLIGSMAISALPPLNGFFSEWLTFQSLFRGATSFDAFHDFPFILTIGALALTSGLAAACFVKVFGVTFLARPRSTGAAQAKEAPFSMRMGMAGLAIIAIALGLFAGPVSRVLGQISANLIPGGKAESLGELNLITVSSPDKFYTISMPAVFLSLLAASIILSLLVFLMTRSRRVRIAPTWDCGTDLTPRMEITATGFARSIITIFKGVLRPSRQTDIEYHDSRLRYFPKMEKVILGQRDIYQPYFYQPLRELISKLAIQVKRIQSGKINAYVLYILLTLLGLLIYFLR